MTEKSGAEIMSMLSAMVPEVRTGRWRGVVEGTSERLPPCRVQCAICGGGRACFGHVGAGCLHASLDGAPRPPWMV